MFFKIYRFFKRKNPVCEELIEPEEYIYPTPEEYIEYPANELEFDDICFYLITEILEISMKQHHGNLDKLPEYLYTMIIKILNNGGIPYIDDVSQMVGNDKAKTAEKLVNQWLTVRDDPNWNGVWFF